MAEAQQVVLAMKVDGDFEEADARFHGEGRGCWMPVICLHPRHLKDLFHLVVIWKGWVLIWNWASEFLAKVRVLLNP